MKILKCFPENLENLVYNKTHALNLYNLLKPKDTNVLLYGIKGCGKKTLIQCVMNTLFPRMKISCNHIITRIINDDTMIYKHNNNYFEINCHTIKQQSKNSVVILIKEICGNFSINVENLELQKIYIIIHNMDILSKVVQNSLLRIIEIYNNTSIFIITTSKINHIEQSLQSRLLMYRLPYDKNELCCMMKNMNINANVSISSNVLDVLLESDINKTSKINQCYNILKDFIKGNIKNILKMKDALQELLSYNIDHIDIIKNIVLKIKVNVINSMKLWCLASEVNIQCLNSSKTLICLEYFVVKARTCI